MSTRILTGYLESAYNVFVLCQTLLDTGSIFSTKSRNIKDLFTVINNSTLSISIPEFSLLTCVAVLEIKKLNFILFHHACNSLPFYERRLSEIMVVIFTFSQALDLD